LLPWACPTFLSNLWESQAFSCCRLSLKLETHFPPSWSVYSFQPRRLTPPQGGETKLKTQKRWGGRVWESSCTSKIWSHYGKMLFIKC
jgi:hypothetical protein